MTYDTIDNAATIAVNGEGTLLAGRYRIVRQLGRGGMGSVWLAEDAQLDGKPFAIKMLPTILVSNRRAYNQLKAEALVAMRLVHPNIVQIRAFEENDGNPFLVMDYVDGQTLDDYIAEHAGATGVPPVATGLPESDVLRILRPIAAALDYAHARGIVHRDVKPGNVMVSKDGTPYILDFGIAREIQETMTRVTGKLSSGTLMYMSPEQLNGAQPRKEQDIYSFAAMAYECLKGEPPFARGQIEHQILNNPPPPIGLSTDETPAAAVNGRDARSPGGALAAGVMAGLAKKPEDRPKSCAAVLEGRVAPQGSGMQQGDGATHGMAGTSRPSQGGALKTVLAVMLLGGLAAGGGWWFYLQEQKREQERIAVEAEAKRQAAEESAKQKAAEEEAKRKAAEGAARRKAAEEAARRKAAEEAAKQKVAAEETKRKAAEEEARRKAAEEAAKQKAAEEETKRKAAEEAARQKAAEEETKRKAAEEEAARRKAAEEDEAKRRAVKEDEERRAAEAAARRKIAAEEEARRNEEKRLEEKRKESEKRAEEAKAFLSRLRKEGFILDEKANRHQPGTERRVMLPKGEAMVMVWCPPGWFMMGSPRTEAERIAGETLHAVRLTKGFWIGKYEVTRSQWAAVAGGTFWFGGNKPISAVSWDGCRQFAAALNTMTGLSMRLPTEAEWEYACRAGTRTPFSFGNVLNGEQACCNGGEPYGTFIDGPANKTGPSDVGSFSAWANAWGVNDMHGNVYEWCADAFAEYPATEEIVEDPKNDAGGDVRVIRGGCWNYAARQCRSAFRTSGNPGLGTEMIGFRLACDDLP